MSGTSATFALLDQGCFTITPYIGTFLNFSSDPTGEKNWENWSEVDLYAGVKFEKGKWALDVLYTEYLYPNGFSHSAGEVGFVLSYNDDELSKKLHLPTALNPHIGFYQEVYDNGDDKSNSYLEFGIRPECKKAFGLDKLSFGVPVTLGTSPGGEYYKSDDGGNDFLGYVGVGIEARYQLSQRWYLKAGVEYDYLMSDSLQNANSDSNNAVIGTFGIGFSY